MEQRALSSRRAVRRGTPERGVILLLACFSMPVLVGLLGLGIDLSVIYSIKAKLQMACDGAAVAAMRSLSLGQDTTSQRAMAQAIASQWFLANFSGEYLGASNTSVPTVIVTDLASSRSVSVAAVTHAPSYFMKYFGRGETSIGASGTTSRRDVAIIMVLDRSGSMAGGSYSGLAACDVMKQAAKQFTGMFQQGRDTIGLVTFGETVQVVQSPTSGFQSALGYTNTAGSATGSLDAISCLGGTNTPSALSVGWNELYKLQMPGALNILVLFTDGLPTAASFNFASTLRGGTCLAGANWISAGGEGNAGSTVSLGLNSYWTPFSGMVGAIFANGSYNGVGHFFSPTGADPHNYESPYDSANMPVGSPKTAAEAPGCQFATNTNPGYGDPTPDLASVPPQDVFGNSGTGYITSGITMAGGNFSLDASTLQAVITNLTDNAASFARSPHLYRNGVTMNGTIIDTIGLGGNGGVDFTLLQRLANDPKGDPTVPYPDFAGVNTGQPQGHFIYAPDGSQLQKAFVTLASQILRISR